MSVQWDQVYGEGFFVANVLGNEALGRAALACKQGTTLNIDFLVVRPGDVRSVKGVGQDSKGNVYKVTF